MSKFHVKIEEQESWTFYDYENKTVSIWTNRPSCARRISKVLGEPDGGISPWASWLISFDDKVTIRKASAINNFLPLSK
ncbi:MAG: hypothetical protein ACK5HP_01775 [Bacilli bacterium]